MIQYPALTTLEFIRQDIRFSKLAVYITLVPRLANLFSCNRIATTLFAPTDTAFAHCNAVMDSKSLESFLRYHVTYDAIRSEVLFDQLLLVSLLPSDYYACDYQRLRVSITATSIQIQESNITSQNIITGNGIVHAMDSPIFPPPSIPRLLLGKADKFSIFLMAANRLGVDMTGEATLFCPSNESWNELNTQWLFSPFGHDALRKIILYHFVDRIEYFSDLVEGRNFSLQTRLDGYKVKIDVSLQSPCCAHILDELPDRFRFVINDGEARIFETDMIARNGTVHRITSVLVPKCVKILNKV